MEKIIQRALIKAFANVPGEILEMADIRNYLGKEGDESPSKARIFTSCISKQKYSSAYV
jgi:hypothetical protein